MGWDWKTMRASPSRGQRPGLILAVLGAIVGIAAAGPPANPDFNGVFVARDPATAQTVSLERQAMRDQSKDHALGLGGTSRFDEIQGAASPVRFRAGQDIEFIVRFSSQALDPAAAVVFQRAAPTKTTRRLSGQRTGLVFGRTTEESTMVGFDGSKYLDHFFLIRPQRPLIRGEYCLSMARTSALDWSPVEYCFGID